MKPTLIAGVLLGMLAMLPPAAAAQVLKAYLLENGHQHKVGVVRLDKQYRLSVVSVPPARKTWLHTLVDEVNAEQTLHVDAPPPADAPQFADVTATVARSDPRFPAALRDHLKRYYDLTLR